MESPGSWARILRECEFCLRQKKAMTSDKCPETVWYLILLNFLCNCCTSDKCRESTSCRGTLLLSRWRVGAASRDEAAMQLAECAALNPVPDDTCSWLALRIALNRAILCLPAWVSQCNG